MNEKPDIRLAQKTAGDVIKSFNISEPPVSPDEIANQLDISIKSSDGLGKSFSGCLMKQGNTFGILYSSAIPSEGFRRFTISHELGHYHLIHQHPHIFIEGELHRSQSHFISYEWFEVEADHFAAELLMPENMFREAIRDSSLGLPAIKKLSEKFRTSLTSTAIRYALHTYDPVAVIVSEGETIDYCFISESLRRIKGVAYSLRKGDPLSKYCPTYRFNKNINNVRNAESWEESCYISYWFPDCKAKIKLNEDIIGLGSYGKTLTVLFTEELPDKYDNY